MSLYRNLQKQSQNQNNTKNVTVNFYNKVNFFGINLDLLTMDETLIRISEFIETKQCIQHVVINVAKLVYAYKDSELRRIINSCGLINVDGSGVIIGAKLLGINIPQRVTGIDLMENLIKYSAQKGYKIFFLGAEENVLEKVVKIYNQKYPKLDIVGYRNGYYSADQEEDIVLEIKNSGANILFVAMSSPKKELFLNKYLNKMDAIFTMGVGGSFDVIAGKVKRAPYWLQKLNSEWIYRLIQEPRRMWKRYLTTNSIFLAMLLNEYFKRQMEFFKSIFNKKPETESSSV